MHSSGRDHLLELFGLDGKVAVVTGAATGLGRAIAILLAQAGARVALADIDGPGVRSVAGEINCAPDEEPAAIAMATDVSDPEAVTALFASAARLGSLEVLVNVAGLTDRILFDEMTVEQYDRIQAVNSRGTFLCVREAIRHMKAGGRGGSIINISSTASIRAATLHSSAYGASKAAVNALTTSIALEVGKDNIRVNAVLPGGFPGQRTAREKNAADVPTEGPLTHLDRIPLGRYGQQAELANVVLFLASRAASYVTGQLIAVDGGFFVS